MKQSSRLIACRLRIRIAAIAAVATCEGVASAQTVADFFPEVAHVLASNAAPSDYFGEAVSVDGSTLVIGARSASGSVADSGSAYVYERQPNGAWTLAGMLVASDGAAGDNFGNSVSIDGNRIVIGANWDDTAAISAHGSAYVFERQANGAWVQAAKLLAYDQADSDSFGNSVSISGDRLVVGASLDDTDAINGHGSAYVYERQPNGAWLHVIKLMALDWASNDQFGRAVSTNGDRIVIGAWLDGTNGLTQGSAYVYERQANGAWAQTAKLLALDGAGYDYFGHSVSIDGDRIAVGAYGDDTPPSSGHGGAYVYERQPDGAWVQTAKLLALDGAGNDFFGYSVSIDGDRIAVGAYQDGTDAISGHGCAYAFERLANGAWSQQAKLVASDGDAFDLFGKSVSVSGGTIVVGAYADDAPAMDQGSVYCFDASVAVNLDFSNTGYTSLAEAIADAIVGEHIAIRNQALQVNEVIDASTKRLMFVGVEPLAMAPDLMLRLASESAFLKSPDVADAGLAVGGTLIAPVGGTLTFEDLSVTGSGRLLQQGATLFVHQDCVTESGGTCYLSGDVLADVVSTAVGGQNRVYEATDIFSSYNNAGATIVQRGTLFIYGNLTNTGTMVGDVNTGLLPPTPGDGFNVGGDYVVGAGASLIMPDPVWWLRVGGNLDIAINDPARFVMGQATIELTGLAASPSQTLEVLSANMGAVMAGFAPSNFPIGALRLRAGAVVNLLDAHANASVPGTEAVYAHSLVVPAGSTLVTNGRKVYVESATIAGTVSDPADIVIVTGTPPCPGDASGDGQVDAADLSLVLVAWGVCSSGCAGDINSDGAVDGIDLSILFTGWGPCGQ